MVIFNSDKDLFCHFVINALLRNATYLNRPANSHFLGLVLTAIRYVFYINHLVETAYFNSIF